MHKDKKITVTWKTFEKRLKKERWFLPLCHIFCMLKDKLLSWKYNLDGQDYNYLDRFLANLYISKSDLRKDMANH